MDVRAVHSSPVFSGTVMHQNNGQAKQAPQSAPSTDGSAQGTVAGLLSPAEKSFFEGLYPESRKDIRAYQAYSVSGGQQEQPTGTMVDRKG